jgi:hypothetical protein
MTIIRLDRLDVTRLAADYSAAVRDALTDNQLAKVRAGDAVAADYVDTGELLAEAVYEQRPHAESIADYGDELVEAERRASASGYRLSRILIGCEYSGIVRDAFRARGHDAMSCDLLATESPGPHYQGDVRDVLNDGWHMAIHHPPCTYLASCQLWRCLPKHDVPAKTGHPAGWRKQQSDEAIEFVRDLMDAPIERWAIENPKGRIGTEIRPADDKLQPYEFGHDHSKETHLWLNNLEPLQRDPAQFIEGRDAINNNGRPVKRWANQCDGSGADRLGPSADRGHKRSAFFTGIADAMADQWGGITAALRAPRATVTQLELFA